MSRTRRFAHFAYDFVVGDDWPTALGIALALALCGLLAHSGISAWWVLPLAVVSLLTVSVARKARPPSS